MGRFGDSTLSAARRYYERVDFYRWLYDKKRIDPNTCTADELPAFRKEDLFQFQEETGIDYHHPLVPDKSVTYIELMTSGTTWRPLKSIFREDGVLRHNKYLFDFIQKWHAGPFKVAMVDRVHPFFYLHKLGLEASGHKVIYIPYDEAYNISYLKDVFSRERPDCIWDLSETWLSFLLRNGVANANHSLKLAFTMSLGYETRKYLPKGLTVYVLFVGLELGGFLASSCPFQSDSYHLIRNDMEMGVLQGTRYRPIGGGELTITQDTYQVFPFVKYSNGDIVDFTDSACGCGFTGRSIVFQGRALAVNVPYTASPPVNWFDIYTEFNQRFSSRIVMLAMRAQRNEDIVSLLSIFIGSADGTEPTLREDLSKDAMWIGAGLNPEWAFAIPVITVPENMIPAEDPKTSKKRTIINCLRKDPPPEYSTLANMVGRLTGMKILREVDSPNVIRTTA